MNFGTTTHIKVENQLYNPTTPEMKTLIVAAPQKAIKGAVATVTGKEVTAKLTLNFGFQSSGATEPNPASLAYVAIRGRAPGEAETKLLYQSSNVEEVGAVYDNLTRTAKAMGGNMVSTPMSYTNNTKAVSANIDALLRPVYDYYPGSPIHIIGDGMGNDPAIIRGVPQEVVAAIQGKTAYAIICDINDNITAGLIETINADGTLVMESIGMADDANRIAIYEDPFNMGISGADHGRITFDVVWNTTDTGVVNTTHYIDSIDELKALFGEPALSLGTGGAAFNAALYLLANGSREGLYVHCPTATPANPYLTSGEVFTALGEATKIQDAYDILCISNVNIATVVGNHIESMSDPELRKERRGYVVGAGIAKYTEAVAAGRNKEWAALMTGLSTATTNAYVTNVITGKAAITSPKMTVLETVAGVVSGKYVTGCTLLVLYVAYRKARGLDYVMADESLPMIERIISAGKLDDVDHLDRMQNSGVMSMYQKTTSSPVFMYYPCTAAVEPVQYAEEYLVVGTDHYARAIRATINKHIANGTENRISVIDHPKTARYKAKISGLIARINPKYTDDLKLFASAKLISMDVNPSYAAGMIIKIRVKYLYAVNFIDIIIYI